MWRQKFPWAQHLTFTSMLLSHWLVKLFKVLKLNNTKVATKAEAKKLLKESPTFSISPHTSYLKLVEDNHAPHWSLLPANHQHVSQRCPQHQKSVRIQTTNATGKILQCRTTRIVFCNRIKHREISITERRARRWEMSDRKGEKNNQNNTTLREA